MSKLTKETLLAKTTIDVNGMDFEIPLAGIIDALRVNEKKEFFIAIDFDGEIFAYPFEPKIEEVDPHSTPTCWVSKDEDINKINYWNPISLGYIGYDQENWENSLRLFELDL